MATKYYKNKKNKCKKAKNNLKRRDHKGT